jgi:hypothetical protein
MGNCRRPLLNFTQASVVYLDRQAEYPLNSGSFWGGINCSIVVLLLWVQAQH